jgi:hypothetical protein
VIEGCRQPPGDRIRPTRKALAQKDSLGHGGFDSGGKIHHSPAAASGRALVGILLKAWHPGGGM